VSRHVDYWLRRIWQERTEVTTPEIAQYQKDPYRCLAVLVSSYKFTQLWFCNELAREMRDGQNLTNENNSVTLSPLFHG
jgi:hypothetical protein